MTGLDRWRLSQDIINQCVLSSDHPDQFQMRMTQYFRRQTGAGHLGLGATMEHALTGLAADWPRVFTVYQSLIQDHQRLDEWSLAPMDFEVAEQRVSFAGTADQIWQRSGAPSRRVVIAPQVVVEAQVKATKVKHRVLIRSGLSICFCRRRAFKFLR